MNSAQFARWLKAQGIEIVPEKAAGHVGLRNPANGRISVMPWHGSARRLGTGLIEKDQEGPGP